LGAAAVARRRPQSTTVVTCACASLQRSTATGRNQFCGESARAVEEGFH
jgi:hypothetical protein